MAARQHAWAAASVLDIREQELNAAGGDVDGVTRKGQALFALESCHGCVVVSEVEVSGTPARRRSAVLFREDRAVLGAQQIRYLSGQILVLPVTAFELVWIGWVGIDERELGSHVELLIGRVLVGYWADRHRPYASSIRSQISLTVGKAGTACHSRFSGTSPTTAIVAACSSSATSGPTSVKPTITCRSSSTTIRARP